MLAEDGRQKTAVQGLGGASTQEGDALTGRVEDGGTELWGSNEEEKAGRALSRAENENSASAGGTGIEKRGGSDTYSLRREVVGTHIQVVRTHF